MLDASMLNVLPGRAFPLGSNVGDTGVRFAIVSRNATRVWLALFDGPKARKPAVEIPFDPEKHRVGDVWSIYIEGLGPGVLYLYRVEGPDDPARGHRFNSKYFLLDPYAKCIVGDVASRNAKCMVVDESKDWIDDLRPRIPMSKTIIYETHVRGFTIHPSSGIVNAGAYKALIQKIPYLKALGVTAVNLLPVQEIGETELPVRNPITGERLTNYWGYNPIGFFAPAGRYASEKGMGEQLREFREMVAALHQAGIEVILDVVFNHTAEGNEEGPTLSFRGIDNSLYYILDPDGSYANYSGCGNTLNCNHPVVRDLIVDCLRYWAAVMHVDGFRFDLASVLGRDQKGRVTENAGTIERIAEDPVLRDVKLIAEAWDAGGAYQVGSFGDSRWAEWNGRYRDDVRRYWRGDPGTKGAFALRLTGSPDLYEHSGRGPMQSINFVTAHDGFTLRDLVSYNRKHNKANGENDRDGMEVNDSWNCGAEGETTDPAVLALRARMQKNFVATLLLSVGVPMILGGDEFGRTQQGNNNAYCQDNEISWYDWTLLTQNEELHRFCTEMIRFRSDNPAFQRERYFTGLPSVLGAEPDILWFDPHGDRQTWENEDPRLGLLINGTENDGVWLYLMFNPTSKRASFRLSDKDWRLRIDTSAGESFDVRDPDRAAPVIESVIVVESRSIVVLSAGTRHATPRLSSAD
ncbi:MAG TPA: glycogen debranching protein GlgX [Candidatus Hydrogenedentes bacterium]|nr:glycogen debranching protein GlgX [Candidatus Hydrogenedentota bacterium]HOS01952.1 glycogen debranching protein GlgX [Candidatus Hydrogenedentota bacterium]